MDVESVKSGRSDRSRHSQSASSRNVIRRPHSSHHIHHQSTRAAGRLAGEPHLRYGLESDTDRDDRSSRISRRHRHHMVDSGHEKITMRLFDDPLDDVTVITGATSEFAYSLEDLRKDPQIIGKKTFSRTLCSKFVGFCGSMLVFLLCLGSFVSPVIMVILPKIPALDWEVDNCDPECESALLGIGFKLLILLVATWALFFRNGRASLPRLDPAKALVIFITFLLTFSFWLFYTVRFFQALTVTYLGVVLFASSLVDSLLFIHYLAVILFELKQLKNRFAVKIVRSPDGASRTYAVGQMTVQNLAVWCLDKYYADFQSYNPYLEILPKKSSGASGTPAFKLYDVDGLQGPAGDDKIGGGRSFSVASSSANGGRAGHNDRFYGEQEYERRVLRRRSRLQASAEEAFAHLKRIRADSGASVGPMLSAREAAQAVFPTLVRPLQKYLRITRQQPKYSMENVLKHLATCISYEMSSKAFLERYLHQGEVVWSEGGWSKLKLTSLKGQIGVTSDTLGGDSEGKKKEPHSWVLTCQGLLNRAVDEKCTVKLTRSGPGGESLLVTFDRLPFFDVVEQPMDVRSERFLLNMNAELSV